MTESSLQPGEGRGDTPAEPVPATAVIGDDDVDAAMERLGELDRLPLDEEVSVYEDVQQRLAGVLERDPDLGES
jgi:hypothetical protein